MDYEKEYKKIMNSTVLAIVLLYLMMVVCIILWLCVLSMPPHNADYMTRGEIEVCVDSIN